MQQTQDLNVVSLKPMLTPRELKADFPMSEDANATVVSGRRAIQDALHGKDDRMLAIVGPCSIHDPDAALEYAGRLRLIQEETRDRLVLVMRTYFEKPRTTIGWKGLINDPHLDGSYDIDTGLRTTRSLLLQINAMGMPTATELLDPIVPQYIADLVSWASIGARTTESQTHREMASGLSMPVGFKNSTDGNMQVAVEALESARHAHHFLGIDQDGKSSVVATRGNAYCHLILRGGRGGANYDPVSIAQTEEHLAAAGLDPRFVVDCSHANSGRRFRLQRHVLRSILQQRIEGARSIVGFMMESNLAEGNQPFPKEGAALRHGVSITDPCIGWDETAHLLRRAAEALRGGGPVVF